MKHVIAFLLFFALAADAGAQPLQAFAGNDTAVCPAPGTNTGVTQPRLGMPATGGTPPYSYLWMGYGDASGNCAWLLDSPANAQPRIVQSTSNIDSAFFVVQVTDAVNVVARDTVRVYFSRWGFTLSQCIRYKGPADTVSIGASGGSINFHPMVYEWTPNVYIDSSLYNGSFYLYRSFTPVTQAYTVYGTDRVGCRIVAGTCSVIVSPTRVANVAHVESELRIVPSPATPRLPHRNLQRPARQRAENLFRGWARGAHNEASVSQHAAEHIVAASGSLLLSHKSCRLATA